jgi:hypothetical protein
MDSEHIHAPSSFDEGPHPHSHDPCWAESWFWNFHAADAIAASLRVGHTPSRERSDHLVVIALADGRALISRALAPLGSERALSCQDLTVRCERPHERWHLSGLLWAGVAMSPQQLREATHLGGLILPPARLELDLVFEALSPPFRYPPMRRVPAVVPRRDPAMIGLQRRLQRWAAAPFEVIQALKMRANGHYEQLMRVQGALRIDGVELPIEAVGHRDHSWGLRDWSAPQRWLWCTGADTSGRGFNVFHIDIAGSSALNGFFTERGQTSPLHDIHTHATFCDDGLGPDNASLHVLTKDGPVTLNAQVIRKLPITIQDDGLSVLYTIGVARWQTSRGPMLGFVEYFERRFP